MQDALPPRDFFAGAPREDVAPELVARYATQTQRDLSNMAWYAVLACFKLGILLEGSHARAMAGFAAALADEFVPGALTAAEEAAAVRLAGDKYGQDSWNLLR